MFRSEFIVEIPLDHLEYVYINLHTPFLIINIKCLENTFWTAPWLASKSESALTAGYSFIYSFICGERHILVVEKNYG